MPNSIKFPIDGKSKKELQEVLAITDKLFTNLEKISTKKIKVQSSKELAKQQKQSNEQTTKAIDLTKQLEKAQQQLLAAQSKEGKQLVELRTEKAKVNAETRKQYKEATALLTPYQKLSKSLKDLKDKAKNLGAEFGQQDERYKAAAKAAAELDAKVKELDKSTGDHQREVGNYQLAFEGLFPAIGRVREALEGFQERQESISGSGGNIAGVFDKIKSGIAGATKAALGFVATPIGAAILVMAGIGLATKKFFDFNNAILETNLLLEGITNKTGDAVNDIRVRAEALNEVFDKDIKESTIAAQKLVVQFGISYGEAFDTIEEGLIKGGTANSEFLESLTEYGQFFSDAGFSAKEFQQIVNAGFDLGIYKDKLPDAVKEFDVSIREQTQGTKDALLNAFGSEFTDTLLNGIKDGSIATKEALTLINEETERVGVNSQQAAQLTADLFRGAGEDAGGYRKVLEAVNLGLQEQQREYNSLEAFQRANIESTKELKQAQDEAFRSEGFIKFKAQLITGWNNIQIIVLKAIASIRESLSGFINGFNIVFEKLTPLINIFKSFVNSIKEVISESSFLNKAFENVGNALLLILSPVSAVVSSLKSLVGVFNGVVNVVYEFNDAISLAFNNLKQAFKDFDITKPFESIQNLDFTVAKYAGGKLADAFLDGYKEVVDNEDLGETIVKNIEVNSPVIPQTPKDTTEATTKTTKALEKLETLLPRVASKIKSVFNVKDEVKAVADSISNDLIKTIDDLADAYDNGEITAKQYLQGVEDAHLKSNDSILTDTISMLEQELEYEHLSADTRKEIEQELYDFKKQLRDKEIAETKEKAETEVATEKNKAERNKKIREDIFQATVQAATMINDAILDSSTQRRNDELAAAQKSYDYEVLLAESSGESTEVINSKKAQSAEKLAKTEARINNEQAKAEKASALFNAVLNTAAAVVSGLAQGGPVLAAINGVLGAIQIGVIAAQPIPKYKTGLKSAKKDHVGIVGDGAKGQNRELIKFPDKTEMLAEKEMYINLPKGTQVLNNRDTENELKKRNDINKLSSIPSQKQRRTVVHNHIKITNKLPLTNYQKSRK